MRHSESYKGHDIAAEAFKKGTGFGWSYQIDGGDIVESRGRTLRTEKSALSEAISEAKFKIDQSP